MTPRRRLIARAMRVAMEALDHAPRGLSWSPLWRRIEQEFPGIDEEWWQHTTGNTPFPNQLAWDTTYLVKTGWLHKDGNGSWRITALGHQALAALPDAEPWWEEARAGYRYWKTHRERFDRLEHTLRLLPEQVWVALDDACAVFDLDRSRLTGYLSGTRPDGWHRVLNANGTPLAPRDGHGSAEFTECRDLLARAGIAGTGGPAPQHRRLSEENLRRLVSDADHDEIEALETADDHSTATSPADTSWPFALPDATDELAEELHFDRDWLQECVELLRDRPQLVFHGPPGTGKTHTARALAAHLTGSRPGNVRLVQFHPAYSYEDFFEGYRPRPAPDGHGTHLALTPGPLRRLADAARERPGEPFVLIIDEINRGNLAKIFGELYFLLEYRRESVHLLYGAEGSVGFTLPGNIVILATMNTADRSIALVDAAMRRRFWFQELHPSAPPTSKLLGRWLAARGLPDDAARLLDGLNARIEDRDFRIGPTYLMREAVHEHPRGLGRVWEHQILPLLVEHHYGDGTDVAGRYGLAALRAQLGLGNVDT